MEEGLENAVEELLNEEIFCSFRAKKLFPNAKPHPADIVEASSLAAVELPPPTYRLERSIPESVIVSAALSELQLEGILYACQRHQLILPNGERAGFFIADGAGVGKGRQIAAIIFDNFVRGRKKHIWFSASSDLKQDAERFAKATGALDLDWLIPSDINCYVKVINGIQEVDKHTKVFGLDAEYKQGVIFSTYTALITAISRGSMKESRLSQVINWCGGAQFDGCLIFDECHKAKSFTPGNSQTSSKVSLAVTTLQRLLPKARVVYVSATGVSEVKNMAFMERLGLWGEGCAFKDFNEFSSVVSPARRGLGMAEMLAMEMKANGTYVSRSISFKETEFSVVQPDLTAAQTQMYNSCSETLWQQLRDSLKTAITRTSVGSRIWVHYWAAHQQFFKQLCLSLRVPCIVEEAKKALAAGFVVVIGLQSTGESASTASPGGRANIERLPSVCRQLYRRFVEENFPVVNVQTNLPDVWCAQCKDTLLDLADNVELPPCPLDDIIEQLGGPQRVAEMTGRTTRIVRGFDGDLVCERRDAQLGTSLESVNLKEKDHFMEGKKKIAIISDAASTGISLHSARGFKSEGFRRVHLTLELPWSADKAVQQLGRTHRCFQVSGPIYKLITMNLGGEMRFASTVAKRLQELGALTKGDRRAATCGDLSGFNFETTYGKKALRTAYKSILNGKFPANVSLASFCQLAPEEAMQHLRDCLVRMGMVEAGATFSATLISEEDSMDVKKFLNRILGLPVADQNTMFRFFYECLSEGIKAARKEGRYNEGLLDIRGSSVRMKHAPKELFTDFNIGGGCSTKLLTLEVDRGLSFEAALARLATFTGPHDGFYVNEVLQFNRSFYILALEQPGHRGLFTIARPNSGVNPFPWDREKLLDRYTHVSVKDAEAEWKAEFDRTLTGCGHGENCKNYGTCTFGRRKYKVTLLTGGGIVSLMNVLEQVASQHTLVLSQWETQLRVVRAELDDGTPVVGLRFPKVLIPAVETALREKAQEAAAAALARGQMSSVISRSPTKQGTDNLSLERMLALTNSQATQASRVLADLKPSKPPTVAGAAGASIKPQPTAEPESEVVPKLVAMATRKRKTLDSFFKPVSKEEHLARLAAESAQEIVKKLVASDVVEIRSDDSDLEEDERPPLLKDLSAVVNGAATAVEVITIEEDSSEEVAENGSGQNAVSGGKKQRKGRRSKARQRQQENVDAEEVNSGSKSAQKSKRGKRKSAEVPQSESDNLETVMSADEAASHANGARSPKKSRRGKRRSREAACDDEPVTYIPPRPRRSDRYSLRNTLPEPDAPPVKPDAADEEEVETAPELAEATITPPPQDEEVIVVGEIEIDPEKLSKLKALSKLSKKRRKKVAGGSGEVERVDGMAEADMPPLYLMAPVQAVEEGDETPPEAQQEEAQSSKRSTKRTSKKKKKADEGVPEQVAENSTATIEDEVVEIESGTTSAKENGESSKRRRSKSKKTVVEEARAQEQAAAIEDEIAPEASSGKKANRRSKSRSKTSGGGKQSGEQIVVEEEVGGSNHGNEEDDLPTVCHEFIFVKFQKEEEEVEQEDNGSASTSATTPAAIRKSEKAEEIDEMEY